MKKLLQKLLFLLVLLPGMLLFPARRESWSSGACG